MRISPARRRKCSSALISLRISFVLLSFALLLFRPRHGLSAIETWNPSNGSGSGSWDTTSDNWSPGQTVWTNSNDAIFSGSGGAVTVVDPVANSLTFAASGAYLLESGTLLLSGSEVTANSSATIASVVDATAGLYVTGSSVLTLTGSTSTTPGENILIDKGTVNIASGGSLSGSDGYLSYNLGSTAIVSVSGSGSIWNSSGTLDVGYSGSGTLEVTNGGVVTVADGLNGSQTSALGYNAGSSGTIVVSGSGSTFENEGLGFEIGLSGSGSVTVIDAASLNTGGAVVIGGAPGGSGIVTISGSGSQWINSGPLYVSIGVLNIEDGASNTNSNFYPTYIGGDASVNISGSNSLWSNAQLYIGNTGIGSLVVTGGGTVISDDQYYGNGDIIGYQNGATGSVTISGSGSSWSSGQTLIIGDYGAGQLFVSSGGLVQTDDISMASNNGSGFLTVTGNGSMVLCIFNLTVGTSGSAELLVANDGTLSDHNSSINYGGVVVLTGTGSSWVNSGSLTIGNPTFAGDAKLFIGSGASVSATQTTVSTSGTLAFGGNATINSPVNVEGGGTLEGSATTGILNIVGALTLTSSAEFIFTLDSTGGALGDGSSELLAYSVSLGSDAKFTLVDLSSNPGELEPGIEYTLIASTAGLSGTFGNLPNGSQFSSGPNTYEATYSPDTLTLTVVNVPEPDMAVFLIGGLVLLGLSSKRLLRNGKSWYNN